MSRPVNGKATDAAIAAIYSRHLPECESLCTERADCNCGAVIARTRRDALPSVIPVEPQWSPYAR